MLVPTVDAALSSQALHLAELHLASVGRRLSHVRTAGVVARRIAVTVPEGDRDLLVAAATLHDIGYADAARVTGFHPLDGARFLERGGWPARLVGLVARHSLAVVQARAWGLDAEVACYGQDLIELDDALLYADMTSGPHGGEVGLDARLADMVERHRNDPAERRRAMQERLPLLLAAIERVDQRLAGGRRARLRQVSLRWPGLLPANHPEGARVTLTAILELHLDPERLDTARQVLKETLVATRAFPGCLGVDVLFDVNDPAHVAVYESWASLEADDAYRAWRAGDGKSRLGTVVTRPPLLTRYTTDPDI